jgi:RNA polymerase sigma-54 factor
MNTRQRLTVTATQRLALNTALMASLRVLKADAAGLTRYLEETAAENPSLILTRLEPGPQDWLPRWTAAFAATSDVPAVAAAPSLIAHVMAEIDSRIPGAVHRAIALHFIEALEPSGWLGRSVAQVAQDAGCSLVAAQEVLTLLQRIEPRGLFARSLAECLRLQADEAGVHDPVMAVMLDHLDLLAKGALASLALRAKVGEADIMARLRLIREFNPKPGAAFVQGAAPVRAPDLIAKEADGGWQITLNRRTARARGGLQRGASLR